MAYEIPGHTNTLLAAADLSSSQYRFVAENSSGRAAVPSAGVQCIGVLQNAPASGRAGTIMVDGVSKVEASAAITAGDKVACTANGRAATVTTGQYILGIARTTAGGAGEYIAVQLLPGGIAA